MSCSAGSVVSTQSGPVWFDRGKKKVTSCCLCPRLPSCVQTQYCSSMGFFIFVYFTSMQTPTFTFDTLLNSAVFHYIAYEELQYFNLSLFGTQTLSNSSLQMHLLIRVHLQLKDKHILLCAVCVTKYKQTLVCNEFTQKQVMAEKRCQMRTWVLLKVVYVGPVVHQQAHFQQILKAVNIHFNSF